MKKTYIVLICMVLSYLSNAQTIPFANLKLATKEFSIEKSSPELDINNNFIYGSTFLSLKKGDAVYVTCKEKDGENIEFYLREKGSKNLLAQVSETANAWFYYKADKDVTLEVFGIIGKNKYLPNPKICTLKYLQGNASDFYYSDKDNIPQKILALAYGKPLAFSNLFYSRNVIMNSKDTTFKNVFLPNDKVQVFGTTLDYTIARNVTKKTALETVNTWKKYIDKAFEKITLEDKQEYNEQDMTDNGFPEIIYSLSITNVEELNYLKKNVTVFNVKLQVVKNIQNMYDITFEIN